MNRSRVISADLRIERKKGSIDSDDLNLLWFVGTEKTDWSVEKFKSSVIGR